MMKESDINAQDALTVGELQRAIADQLAAERLAQVNAASRPVKAKDTFYTRHGKRMIDFVVSLIAFILTLPINLMIAVATLFDVGRPLIFRQERTGKDGKSFTIYKFRNMRNTVDERGELLPAYMRVTKWGRFVRKTSLDELLNFWSVLKGDMSLIGPRPLPPQYLNRYSDRHRARLALRPGLECPPRSGKADQVRSWNDQFENDVWYVENVSLGVDIMMLVRLAQFALDRRNATARANVTRGSFIGYSEQNKAMSVRDLSDEYVWKTIDKLGLEVPVSLERHAVQVQSA